MNKKPLQILGLDPGKRRIGIAIGNSELKIATGLKTIEYKGKEDFIKTLSSVTREMEIDLIVLGLPRNMDGSEGDSAKFSRRLAEIIRRHLKLKIEFIDERLTTKEAVRQIHETGKKVGKSKETIDMLSAVLILQTYLDKI
jgi:putative Holliday junction resolvase